MLRELDSHEQKRMTVSEAGSLYDGHFIFFTNFEEAEMDSIDDYAVPRVISLTNGEFNRSGLYEKYKNQDGYGVPFFCSHFIASENRPPILAF